MKFLVLFYSCIFSSLIFDSSKRKYSDDEFTYEFSVTNNSPKTKLAKDIQLYWYALEKVQSSFYDFNGKLLHGNYKKSLNNSKAIIEEGFFLYGMKDGEWKKWDDQGNLLSVTNWKKGRKQGVYELYDKNRKIITRGAFREGQKTGKWISVKNGILINTTWSKDYLNGVYREHDSLGNLLKKGRYKRNMKTGIWTDYIQKTRKRYDSDKIVNENVETFWDTFKEKKN